MTPYRDGTTHVVLEPLDFIDRLAVLVPRPRVNLTRYHGLLSSLCFGPCFCGLISRVIKRLLSTVSECSMLGYGLTGMDLFC